MRLLMILIMVIGVLSAESRVALLIGNGDYPKNSLTNPTNDVDLLEEKLTTLGFDVIKRKNRTRSQIIILLKNFRDKIDGNTIALIYFSGHGVNSTLDNKNYLMPIGAFENLLNEADLSNEAISDGKFLASTAGAKFSILLLDACRSHDFAQVRGDRGLGQPQGRLSNDYVISYATEIGKTAEDGDYNSPYAKALAKYLTSKYSIGDIFTQVRAKVSKTTNGEQKPYYDPHFENILYLSQNKEVDKNDERKKNITQFFTNLVKLMKNKKVNKFMKYFDNEVLYYGKYTSKEQIQKDKQQYLNKWNQVDYEILHINISNTNQQDVIKVTMLMKFDVTSKEKRVYGQSSATYKLNTNHFKITYENSKIVSSKKIFY